MKRVERKFRVWGGAEKWSKFRIITVHPLADQIDLLRKLQMMPEQCTSVGVYWLYRDRIYFISVFKGEDDAEVYVERDAGSVTTFIVRTLKAPLTTAMLERMLHRLAEWVDRHIKIEKKSMKMKSILKCDLLARNSLSISCGANRWGKGVN